MPHLNPAPDVVEKASCSVPLRCGFSAADFEHFVREYHERLLALSTRLLRSRDDAADALQDALLSAWLGRHTFQGQSTVYTWLYRVVRNCCLMKIRSQSAAIRQIERCAVPLHASSQNFPAASQPFADSAELAEEDRLLRLKLEQLPAKYRQILVLRELEQLSTAETAARLSVSPSIVKTRLCRARAELRHLCAGDCAVS